MNTSNFIAIKSKINTVVNPQYPEIISLIQEHVRKINNITFDAYIMVNSYLFWLIEQNKELPVINSSFVRYCLMVVTDNSSEIKKGRPIGDKELYRKLKFYYGIYLKRRLTTPKESNYRLSTSITLLADNMLRCMETHIKTEYTNQLYRFIYNSLRKLDTIATNGQLKELANRIRNNILDGKEIKEQKYQEWINEHINNIVPVIENNKKLKYNLKTKPFMFLKSLIYMNKHLQEIGMNGFNCFTLQTTNIPRYVEFDTSVILELLGKAGTTNSNNIESLKNEVWNKYFRIQKTALKSSTPNSIYKFNGSVKTDGISVSISYALHLNFENGLTIKKNQRYKKGNIKQLKIDQKIKKSKIEFPYLDELSKEEFNNLKTKKKVYIDPGKNDIVYCMDDNNNCVTYSNIRRNKETKRNHFQRIRNKINEPVKQLETEFSKYSRKTYDFKEFMEYVKEKSKLNNLTRDHYSQPIFRNLRFRSYCLTKSSEDKFVNQMKKTYGDDIVLMYGDKNIGKQLRNFISTPMIGFKRKLKKHFKVYNVDEFRTSCLHHKTSNNETGKVYRNKKVYIKKKEGIEEKTKILHKVLVATLQDKDTNDFLSYVNRDKNACYNIRRLVTYELENGKGKRPYWFCRTTKIDNSASAKT